MSDIFFEEIKIPGTHYFLNVNALNHGAMTGQMLEIIEGVLIKENPDLVMVYGDTNTSTAGSLAAVKLHIPISHIEAGLRSYNRQMPEEVNRLVSDHLSTVLFCPTMTAVENLKLEGIKHSEVSKITEKKVLLVAMLCMIVFYITGKQSRRIRNFLLNVS
jgi:UDP-GlcNAc3NAcA epimerase